MDTSRYPSFDFDPYRDYSDTHVYLPSETRWTPPNRSTQPLDSTDSEPRLNERHPVRDGRDPIRRRCGQDESLIEELLESLETRDAQLKSLQEESASLRTQLQDATARAASFQDRYKDAKDRISVLQKDINVLQSEHNELGHELAVADWQIRNDREKAEEAMAKKSLALETLQKEHTSVVERLKLLESRAENPTRILSQPGPIPPRSPRSPRSPRTTRFKPQNEAQGNPGCLISSECISLLSRAGYAVSASSKPYDGPRRRLILGIDVGTTFSGVSYSILDPGVVPIVQGVNRCVAQCSLRLSVDGIIITQLPSPGQGRR
jgi:archaellum component FlaC